MKQRKLGIKIICFIIGVYINAFGIDLVTKGNLGTSPISSVAYVLSLRFDALSFGMATFLMNAVFLVMQIIILRGRFNLPLLLQLPASFLLGFFVNVNMALLDFLNPTNLFMQLISVLLGCLILGLGISIEVAPNIVKIPGEGIVYTMSEVYHGVFGHIKVSFDITLVIISVILSFIFFGRLNGLGIGTIISALLVGRFVNLFNRLLTPTYDRFIR